MMQKTADSVYVIQLLISQSYNNNRLEAGEQSLPLQKITICIRNTIPFCNTILLKVLFGHLHS